jgi:hypothetical protein
MNLSELVGNKLPEIKKILFGSYDTSADVDVTDETPAFLDAKLTDGTIVRIEPDVEVGASVKIIDEEANEIDAPDGDHELEDGTVIRTEGAVVVEVMAPEVEEEAPEAKAEEVDEEVDLEVKMAAIADDVVASKKFASAKSVKAINDRFAEVERAISMITDIVEKIAAKPSVEPTKKVVNPFSRSTTDADLVERMRKALKK